jgi:hypothetical protein
MGSEKDLEKRCRVNGSAPATAGTKARGRRVNAPFSRSECGDGRVLGQREAGGSEDERAGRAIQTRLAARRRGGHRDRWGKALFDGRRDRREVGRIVQDRLTNTLARCSEQQGQ